MLWKWKEGKKGVEMKNETLKSFFYFFYEEKHFFLLLQIKKKGKINLLMASRFQFVELEFVFSVFKMILSDLWKLEIL